MLVKFKNLTYGVHWKHEVEWTGMDYKQRPQKGLTVCMISLVENGKPIGPVFTGRSTCSELDQFDYELGRKQSLTRAMRTFLPSVRQQFWATYLNRSPNGLSKSRSAIKLRRFVQRIQTALDRSFAAGATIDHMAPIVEELESMKARLKVDVGSKRLAKELIIVRGRD